MTSKQNSCWLVKFSQIAPGATDVRDLPGGRRFTPVNVSSSSSTMSHMTPNTPSSIYSPHMSTYTPKYSSSNGLHPPPGSSPSANLHTTTLFLEEENRQLRATVNTLKENARKVEFLQQSLDHVQVKITNQQMRLSVGPCQRAYRQQVRAEISDIIIFPRHF